MPDSDKIIHEKLKELERRRDISYRLGISKSDREENLNEIRKLEAELGIKSPSYNSDEWKRRHTL